MWQRLGLDVSTTVAEVVFPICWGWFCERCVFHIYLYLLKEPRFFQFFGSEKIRSLELFF